MASKGFLQRLKDGESIIIAEGYMWELERRGYVKFGEYTPEVVLEKPELVRMMHEEYAHAGSDVVEAFTYLGNRKRLRAIGIEDGLEELNRRALRMARQVADDTGSLMAGDISHTWHYQPDDPKAMEELRDMFKEQIEWAVEEKADYIIGETFQDYGEAAIALEMIKKYGNGLPAVITLTPYQRDSTLDDVPIPEACRRLEDAGADVVGLNCARGPTTMMPLLKEVRKVCKIVLQGFNGNFMTDVTCEAETLALPEHLVSPHCQVSEFNTNLGPLAAIPVPFRCRGKFKTFQSLLDPDTGDRLYPDNLSAQLCTRREIRQFAEEAKALGVQYIGLCCGNSPAFLREVTDVYGRTTGASNYSPDFTNSLSRSTVDKHKKLQSYMFDVDY